MLLLPDRDSTLEDGAGLFESPEATQAFSQAGAVVGHTRCLGRVGGGDGAAQDRQGFIAPPGPAEALSEVVQVCRDQRVIWTEHCLMNCKRPRRRCDTLLISVRGDVD